MFFYPSKEHFITPSQIGLAHEDITLTTPDQETLHGWLLPAKGKMRGTVYFLHGNAENISTHIASVMWLPEQGYQVFLLDYRGYGLSTGAPDIDTALVDVEAGYKWLMQRPETKEPPVFILGQSLGAALAVTFSAQMPDLHERVRGIIIDSAFSSFRGIAREKLNTFWLTWPLQYPLSWLIPGTYDPQDHIAAIAPTPVLIIHSIHDEVVPPHHSKILFEKALAPKQLMTTSTEHNGTFAVKRNRAQVLDFMEKLNPSPPATRQPIHPMQANRH